MPLYKSPKSGKLIEVESDFDTSTGVDRAREEATSKGWRPVHRLVSKSGKQIDVDDDALDEALGKGWMLPEERDAMKAPLGVGAGESLARGVAQGTTFGFADEAQAAIRAPFSDKSYSQLRDEYRGVDDASENEQSLAFYGGAIGSGLASGGLGVAKGVAGAATLGKTVAQGARVGALEGAAGGFGAGRGDAASQIESIGMGAATGGLLGGVGAGIGGKLTGRPLSDPAKQGAGLLDVAKASARDGAKEVDLLGIPLVDGARKAVGAAKGAAKGVKDVRAFGREVESLSSGKVLDGAGVPPSGGYDPGADLFLPGASKTKDFVASQAGQLSGNVDPKLYKQLLEMGVDDLVEAKNFDPRAAAREMVPDLEGLQSSFEKARTTAFKEGQAGARAGFDASNAQKLTLSLDEKLAAASADDLMPDRTRKVLEVIRRDLTPGKRFSAAGEALPQASSADTFDTLQRARQTLDSEIDWAKEGKFGSGERLLRQLRGEIDEVLKSAPGKREADELFQRSMDVENGFFGATEFRQPGSNRMEVDEFKLARLLGNTDTAGRFANQIENARAYFSEPRFPEEFRKAQLAMLDRIDAARKRYGDKRTLEALRQGEGPTSPAVNAKAYLLDRAGLPADSIGQPANNLRSMAEYVEEFVHKGRGKKFADLSPEERVQFARLYTWRKANPKASPEEMQAAANKIFGAKQ